MNWFKKKEKNKLLVSSSHIKDIDVDYDISNLIVKASSNLPKWWSTLKVNPLTPKLLFNKLDNNEDPTSNNNTRTCPSFINIFNNSYLLKCPTDLYISIENDSYRWYSADNNVLKISHHPLSQMNSYLEGEYFSLKFDLPHIVKPTTTPLSLVFLPPTYYNDFPFHIMPGVLELLPSFSGNLALNCLVKIKHTNEPQQYFFPKGYILSMLYCTTPPPPIEKSNLTYNNRDHLQGFYLKEKKKYFSNKSNK